VPTDDKLPVKHSSSEHRLDDVCAIKRVSTVRSKHATLHRLGRHVLAHEVTTQHNTYMDVNSCIIRRDVQDGFIYFGSVSDRLLKNLDTVRKKFGSV